MKPVAAVALLVVVVGVAVQSGQPGEGAIEGVVVDVATGTPIAEARVIATPLTPPAPTADPPAATGPGPQPSPPSTAITDASGRFVLDRLAAGAYRLAVVAPDYARQLVDGSRPIELATGDRVRDVRLALQATGTIGGRIHDQNGRPVAGVSVQVLGRSHDPLGAHTFEWAGSGVSDDRGEYRVSGVTPGRYHALAAPQIVRGGMGSAPNAPSAFSIVPTFYPNAPDLAAAMTIDVVSGAERSGIDFLVERQPLRRITGRVLDAATGAPPEAAQVSLLTEVGVGTTRRGPIRTYNPEDGTFELREVPAGRHYVIAEMVAAGVAQPWPPPLPIMPAAAGGAFSLSPLRDFVTASGQVAVDASHADIEAVTIVVTVAFPVRGRVTLSGGASPTALERLQVQLTPLRRTLQVQAPQPATVAPDGSFEIAHVLPGEYRVQVAGLHPNLYLESAHANGVDVASAPLEMTGAMTDDLHIVVSARVSTIDGIVTDARGQPVPGTRVTLVPVDRPGRLDRLGVAPTGRDGRFEMHGVAPGEYRLFAVDRVNPFGFLDAEVLSRYESEGRPVRISAASRQTVQVRFTPAEP